MDDGSLLAEPMDFCPKQFANLKFIATNIGTKVDSQYALCRILEFDQLYAPVWDLEKCIIAKAFVMFHLLGRKLL